MSIVATLVCVCMRVCFVCLCGSRIENSVLRIEDQELCIEDRESGIEDQGLGFNTEFCPL